MRNMKNTNTSLTSLLNLHGFGLLPLLSLVFASILALCISSSAQAQALDSAVGNTSYTETATGSSKLFALEHHIFDLVNEERAKNGISPLIWVDQIATVARYHSASMAEYRYFSHEDLEGRQPDDRANQFGISGMRHIGENIAWVSGYDDPAKRALDCWLESTGHRRNILNPDYTESGIGVSVTANGRYYFTQDFVGVK